MRVLSRGEWLDGFLDYWRPAETYRVRVERFVNLQQLDDVYFVRHRSPRMVLNYLRELGPIDVARKILARSKERRRNEKYVSVGTGTVLESPPSGRYSPGQHIAFVAPCHPACIERLVLLEALLAESSLPAMPDAARQLSYLPLQTHELGTDRWWTAIQGWTDDCGVSLDADPAASLLSLARQTLAQIDWQSARPLSTTPTTEVAELTPTESRRAQGRGKRRAVLFGMGNYAKTMTMPSMSPYCDVASVHEVDPVTVPRPANSHIAWDTCPYLRADENCDVCLIAGFHHTHAPLAVEAMRRGAAAVVEKPIATTEQQLEELVEQLHQGRGALFACYQKRYHPFNELAYADLGVAPGEPISYHCIVYEVPLPRLHWYRWPASGSRIMSNGCHWIDHFLHLNPGARIKSYHLTVGPGETVNCSVNLDSGAMFTMVLTEVGSSRLGVREYVELRTRDGTVAMTDGCLYRAETSRRITTRRRLHRYAAHRAMYTAIGRKILAGENGDSVESVERSGGLILALDSAFQSQVRSDDTTFGRQLGRYAGRVATS